MNTVISFIGIFLPGLCWWVWTNQEDRDPVEIIARIVGVSIGFVAVFALLLFVLGVSVGSIELISYLAVLILFFLLGWVKRKNRKYEPSWLAALLLVGIVLGWRLWQARDLLLPNWVDSLHHALIVRKMVEAGGLTATLEPYLPGQFYYHYAFHSFTALFSHMSGIDPARSVLLVGQVLIASISLSAYSLAKALSRDWRAGWAAAMFVTFVTKMPGYYLSWGRYTMVVGVLMLGLAVAEAVYLWRRIPSWRQSFALLLLTAGTLLSHYLAAFLLGLFLLLQGFQWIGLSLGQKRWDWGRILNLAIPVMVAAVLTLPWYLRIFRYAGLAMNLEPLRTLENITEAQWNYTSYLIGPNAAYPLLAIALAGIVWALTQSQLRVFGGWGLLIAALTLPLSLQITPFRSDYYALLVFLPAGVLVGMLWMWISDRLAVWLRIRGLTEAVAIGLVFVFMMVGVGANISAVNPETTLVTPADIRALDWINEHLPSDARFFINTTPWGYGVSRGVDGGAWILPYTGRWSLVPTIFYPFGGREETSANWMGWAVRAAEVSSCDKDFYDLVREAGLSHLYLSDRAGTLQATILVGCKSLQRLFSSDEVSIWYIEAEDVPH